MSSEFPRRRTAVDDLTTVPDGPTPSPSARRLTTDHHPRRLPFASPPAASSSHGFAVQDGEAVLNGSRVRPEPDVQLPHRTAPTAVGQLQVRMARLELDKTEKELDEVDWTPASHNPYQAGRSILSYLKQPNDGRAPFEAACEVLSNRMNLPQTTDEQCKRVAEQCMLVYKYIQGHALWRGCGNTAVRSADDLIRILENGDTVQHYILIATRGKAGHLRRVRFIDQIWGRGWFDRVPASMRTDEWYAEDCSREVLDEIRRAAERGDSLSIAVAAWEESFKWRTNNNERKRRCPKAPTTKRLLPFDIRGLGQAQVATQSKRLAAELHSDESSSDNESDIVVRSSPDKGKAPVRNRTEHSAASAQRFIRVQPQREVNNPALKRQRRSSRERQLAESQQQVEPGHESHNGTVSPITTIPNTNDSRPSTLQSTLGAQLDPDQTRCGIFRVAADMRWALEQFRNAFEDERLNEQCCEQCEAGVKRLHWYLDDLIAMGIEDLARQPRHSFLVEESSSL